MKDISRKLQVRPPSITEMMKKLEGYSPVNYESWGGITLTAKGKKIAKIVKTKHDTIKTFLNIILVSDETAEEDACKLEHDLTPHIKSPHPELALGCG